MTTVTKYIILSILYSKINGISLLYTLAKFGDIPSILIKTTLLIIVKLHYEK